MSSHDEEAATEETGLGAASPPDVDACGGKKPPERTHRKSSWLHRMSIRQIRHQALSGYSGWLDTDKRDNDVFRLPDSESVNVAGYMLVEAFTPSTISGLREALDKPRWRRLNHGSGWSSTIVDGRSAGGTASWRRLGTIRPPGKFIGDDGYNDPAIPDGIEAVWLELIFPTPSLTLLVATFNTSEPFGDISETLRVDRHTEMRHAHVFVDGFLGEFRSRIPWSRPRHYVSWSSMSTVDFQKGDVYFDFVERHERECWEWLATNFPGRFSLEAVEARPVMRLVATMEEVPFGNNSLPFRALGLDSCMNVWRSPQAPGWGVSLMHTRANRGGPFRVTAACRRRDAADSDHVLGDPMQTWYLTYRFNDSSSQLVAIWAIDKLMDMYASRLSDLRDRSGRRRKFRRPVREARALDHYMMRDGLDASTVASDLAMVTDSPMKLLWQAPDYLEDLDYLPEELRAKTEPRDLGEILRTSVKTQAQILIRDTEATTKNIIGSAEIRQSIANTRLQRTVLLVTVLALIVAIASLVVAMQSSTGH